MAEKPHTKFNELTRSQKIEHIGEYYKFHIIGGVIGLLFIFWMLNHYIFNPPAALTMDVSLFGSYANYEENIALEEALNAYVIDEGVNEKTMVEFFPIREDLDPQTQQATVSKMVAKATIGEFDIMIFGNPYYQNYLIEDTLVELDSLIERGVLDPGDYPLIKGTDVDYDSESHHMVDLSTHPGMQRLFPDSETIYLAIYFKADPENQLERALDYLINEFE